MVANALAATGKFFTLLAVACGLLGLFSLNVAKADPPPCNCGVPDPSAWMTFTMCYYHCTECNTACGGPRLPGEQGYDAWLACYNGGNCASVVSCAYPLCFDNCVRYSDGTVGGTCTGVSCNANCVCKAFLTIAVCK